MNAPTLPCATACASSARHTSTRADGVLILGLRQQALRVGHFDDARETGLVARPGLRFALLRRSQLHRRVRGNRPGRLRPSRPPPAAGWSRSASPRRSARSPHEWTPPTPLVARAGSRSRTGSGRPPARRPPSWRDRGRGRRRRRRAIRSDRHRSRARRRSTEDRGAADPSSRARPPGRGRRQRRRWRDLRQRMFRGRSRIGLAGWDGIEQASPHSPTPGPQ